MTRLNSILHVAAEIAIWAVSLSSLAVLLAVLQGRDWLSSAWAFVTLSICGTMIVLRKKKEKRLKFTAIALIPFATVSLVAGFASFFGSAGWGGYGTFGFYLVPVVVVAISHGISVLEYAKEPIQLPEPTAASGRGSS